ncbi:MAG: HAD family hydrolase [Euryarchaeota archaeon]|nr:HAD family hydrolase [Euryarchaeota archaeon]
MIKAILFDISGTLIDPKSSERAHKMIISKITKTTNKSLVEDIFKKFNEKVNEIFTEMSIRGDYLEYYKICYKALKEVLGNQVSISEDEYKRLYVDTLANMEELFPEVKDVLEELKRKGYTLGVITDGDREYTEKLLKKKSIITFFDIIVSAEDVRRYKPSKDVFIQALKMLDLSPDQVIYVGDNPIKDKIGPESVGIKAYIAKNGISKEFLKELLGETHE